MREQAQGNKRRQKSEQGRLKKIVDMDAVRKQSIILKQPSKCHCIRTLKAKEVMVCREPRRLPCVLIGC